MKHLIIGTILSLSFLGGASGCQGQKSLVVKHAENDPSSLFWEYHGKLSMEQIRRLEQIHALPYVLKTKIVQVNWRATKEPTAIVNLSGFFYFPLDRYIAGNGVNGTFINLSSPETGLFFVITQHKDTNGDEAYRGRIQTKRKTFLVQPLGGGLQAISEVDESKCSIRRYK